MLDVSIPQLILFLINIFFISNGLLEIILNFLEDKTARLYAVAIPLSLSANPPEKKRLDE